MIKVGDKIPSAKLRKVTPTGVEEVSSDDFFRGRKVVLFSVPGAFTRIVTMLADGNADFTRALGLDIDFSVAGMGVRAKRAALIVDDGVVRSVEVEAKPSDVTGSGADRCLTAL